MCDPKSINLYGSNEILVKFDSLNLKFLKQEIEFKGNFSFIKYL
jgi:hypothetical protein